MSDLVSEIQQRLKSLKSNKDFCMEQIKYHEGMRDKAISEIERYNNAIADNEKATAMLNKDLAAELEKTGK